MTTAADTKVSKEKTKVKSTAARSDKRGKNAPSEKTGIKGFVTAILSDKKKRYICMAAISFVLVVVLVIGIIAGARSCNKAPRIVSGNSSTNFSDKPASKDMLVLNPVDTSDPAIADIVQDAYKFEYPATSAVGFASETISTVERKVSTSEDGRTDERRHFELGVETPEDHRYPTYGSSFGYVLGNTDQAKTARTRLIQESSYLTATGTANAGGGGFTWMDENGYLYSGVRHSDPAENTPAYYPRADGDTSALVRRKLYKHEAAYGMYFEGVGGMPMLSDAQDRIAKQVTIRPRGYNSYSVTGIYAPAGEIIKIQLSDADMNATGGITVHIGQALYNGQSNNIWPEKGQMQRFPNILNTMTVNRNTAEHDEEKGVWTAYVGSFLGGPLYIRNTGRTFTATISGGVEYTHFILGYTSKEEYERIKNTTTAPYFDLEVWNYGVLLSGPLYYARNYSFDDLYKVATLWEKISSVTTTNSNQGIVFLFDPFVAAGAAVAFPGRSSVNCPAGWMSGALNYNGLVTSGSWGNLHEYHHNFQNYGVGNGGEVTNNGMTLVSYALFTKISSKRGISGYGGQGLGGWNNYTSATWALNEVLKLSKGGTPSNGKQGLSLYSTLLHNFGANNYIQAKVAQQRGGFGQSYAGYMRAWEAVTHNDMTYFFTDILKGLTQADAKKWHNTGYKSVFVPVSSVYQTGRSYMYDGVKKYFKTMQPYLIANAPFDVDLGKYTATADGQYISGSVVIPDGFNYRVKSVTKPKNGTIEIVDNLHLKYTPVADAKTGSTSGQIVVTLEITKKGGGFKVDDVDLVLEFEISQEINRMTLQRTTYTYEEANMYTDAVEAYDANFKGYAKVDAKWDHSNPTQNANTDIWFYNDANASRFPNADPERHKLKDNVIEVIDGKLYFENDGKYRIYLRGRKNCAVYFKLDGNSYELGARVTNGSGSQFYTADKNTYFDVMFDEGRVTVTSYCGGEDREYTYTLKPDSNNEIINWLYVKEVLIVRSADASYIGLGTKQWTETMFTMEETYHTSSGATEIPPSEDTPAQPVTPDHESYAYTKTVYRDYQGNEVAHTIRYRDSEEIQYFKTVENDHNVVSSADEVAALTESRMIAPTSANYVNAYRADYNFPDNTGFESDYFYTRAYNYNYIDSEKTEYSTWDTGVRLVETNFVPENSNYVMDNILKEGTTTYCHNSPHTSIGVYITLDMGKTLTANDITFMGRTDKNALNTAQGLPTKFKLEISRDGNTFEDAGTYTQSIGSVYNITVNLNKSYTFRYAKITVLGTHSNTGRLILSGIKFGYTLRLTGNGSNLIAPTNENIIFGKNWESRVAESTFGRVHVGNAGDKAYFEFTGTRLAILTSDIYGKNFEVYIDGVKTSSVKVVEHSGVYGITYLTDKLEKGKHKVEIRCTGEVSIDSFAIYDET